jgi:hypothetical protein
MEVLTGWLNCLETAYQPSIKGGDLDVFFMRPLLKRLNICSNICPLE